MNTGWCVAIIPVQNSLEGIDCLTLVSSALRFHNTSIQERRIFCRASTDNIETFGSYKD